MAFLAIFLLFPPLFLLLIISRPICLFGIFWPMLFGAFTVPAHGMPSQSQCKEWLVGTTHGTHTPWGEKIEIGILKKAWTCISWTKNQKNPGPSRPRPRRRSISKKHRISNFPKDFKQCSENLQKMDKLTKNKFIFPSP